LPKGCLSPNAYYTKYFEGYFRDGVIDEFDIIFAVETHPSSDLFGLFIDKVAPKISTGSAYKFKTTFAFVYPIEFEHVELCMADLALISLVAFVDALVD
jgi:hypothetical protein